MRQHVCETHVCCWLHDQARLDGRKCARFKTKSKSEHFYRVHQNDGARPPTRHPQRTPHLFRPIPFPTRESISKNYPLTVENQHFSEICFQMSKFTTLWKNAFFSKEKPLSFVISTYLIISVSKPARHRRHMPYNYRVSSESGSHRICSLLLAFKE